MFYVLEPQHVNPYFGPLKGTQSMKSLGITQVMWHVQGFWIFLCHKIYNFFITNHIFVWSWFNGLHAKPHGSVNHWCAWSPLHYETLFIFNHIIFHVNFSNVLGFFRSTKVNQHPHWVFHFLWWSFIKIKLNPRNVWFWLKDLDFD